MKNYCVLGLIVCLGVFSSACGTSESEGRDWNLGENNGTPLDAGDDPRPDVNTGPDVDAEEGCLPRVPRKHRAGAQACDDQRNVPEPDIDPVEQDYGDCTVHADCTAGDNGRCVSMPRGGWHCTYDECFEDADCGAGNTCACQDGWSSDNNVCKYGNCRTDADCGDNGYCSPSFGDCGAYSGVVGYFCHTCEDECIDDSDCSDTEGYGEPYCMFNQSVGHWMCSAAMCVG